MLVGHGLEDGGPLGTGAHTGRPRNLAAVDTDPAPGFGGEVPGPVGVGRAAALGAADDQLLAVPVERETRGA